MVVVEVLHGLLLLATLLVEEVGGDVVQVNELAARFLCHLPIPLAVGVVAALYLAILPFVARRQRDQNGRSTFFADILDVSFWSMTFCFDRSSLAACIR